MRYRCEGRAANENQMQCSGNISRQNSKSTAYETIQAVWNYFLSKSGMLRANSDILIWWFDCTAQDTQKWKKIIRMTLN